MVGSSRECLTLQAVISSTEAAAAFLACTDMHPDIEATAVASVMP